MEPVEQDFDTHLCLNCHATIKGLMNYVRHKQCECQAQKSQHIFLSNNEHQNSSNSNPNETLCNGVENTGESVQPLCNLNGNTEETIQPLCREDLQNTTFNDVCQLSGTTHSSDIPVSVENPLNHLIQESISSKEPSERMIGQLGKNATEKCEDFFLSLELQSKSNKNDPKDVPTTSSQSRTIDHSLSQNHSDLPISNILSSLDFSSDESEFSYQSIGIFDDVSFDDHDYAPPRTHTGGKWKPGEGPFSRKIHPYRGYTGGKWKPSMFRKSNPDPEHTGGKWKPGEGPRHPHHRQSWIENTTKSTDSLRSSRQLRNRNKNGPCLLCNSSFSYDHKCKKSDRHVKDVQGSLNSPKDCNLSKEAEHDLNSVKNGPPIKNKEEMENRHIEFACSVCNKTFYSKYVLARHILTRYHQNRARSHPSGFEVLEKYYHYVVRLSPFQCRVCRFYFNRENDLLEHVKTDEHVKMLKSLVGPLLCTVCKLTCTCNAELLEHLVSREHRQVLEAQKQICIIREIRHQVQCPFCAIIIHSAVKLYRHIQFKHKNGEKMKATPRRKGKYKPDCQHCGLSCHSLSSLKIHIRRRHTKEKPYSCEICMKRFSDKYSLKAHEKSEKHMEKEAKRNGTEYNEQANVLHKRKLQNVNLSKNCLEFEYAINEEEKEEMMPWKDDPKKQLEHKAYKNQKRTKIYKCDHCEFTAPSYADLRPHYLSIHSGLVYNCNHCKQVFLTEKALRVHYAGRLHQQKVGKTNSGKMFECEFCGKMFEDQLWCRFHVEMYHNHLANEEAVKAKFQGKDKTSKCYNLFLKHTSKQPRNASMQCPDCFKVIKKPNVMEHLRMHSGEKPFVCRFCQKAFISSPSLRRHILGHLGLMERKCHLCGKEFKKPCSFNMHMKKHKTSDDAKRQYACDICKQAFPFEVQLIAHKRRHGKKLHKCTFPNCHWDFVFKSELDSHMRTHTGEKPFLCHICGYAGATKTRLMRHSKTHTGERTFHCEYCTYKAGNSTHLRRHMRIHIGSKPYKCPYCMYTCNTHENMRKHITKTTLHQGLSIYPCKFCLFGTNSTKDFRNHLLEKHSSQVDHKSLEVLSVFTGLYDRAVDPRQPPEGTQILPVKERKPKPLKEKQTTKNDDYISDVHMDQFLNSTVDKNLNMSESSNLPAVTNVQTVVDCQEDNSPIMAHLPESPPTTAILPVMNSPSLASSLDLGYCTTVEYI